MLFGLLAISNHDTAGTTTNKKAPFATGALKRFTPAS
jgi:hypothetical protein